MHITRVTGVQFPAKEILLQQLNLFTSAPSALWSAKSLRCRETLAKKMTEQTKVMASVIPKPS